MKSILNKFYHGMFLAIVFTFLMPLLIFTVLLILFAPVPQLTIHGRWCWLQLGFTGKIILVLGFLGVISLVIGAIRRKPPLLHTGALVFTIPVIGTAIHRGIVMSYWKDISLLGAFLFSVFLIYMLIYGALKYSD